MADENKDLLGQIEKMRNNQPVPDTMPWNTLTFGEQWWHFANLCKQSGASFDTKVAKNSISINIALPDNVSLDGLVEKEAKEIGENLTNKLEKWISQLLWSRDTMRRTKREANKWYKENSQPSPWDENLN